jgi:hypothetical protein
MQLTIEQEIHADPKRSGKQQGGCPADGDSQRADGFMEQIGFRGGRSTRQRYTLDGGTQRRIVVL